MGNSLRKKSVKSFGPVTNRPTKPVKSSDVVTTRPARPLSYQASKCVMEHLEANARFLLVSHCPALRNRHMTVPLKIQYLKLDSYDIHINNCKHSFPSDDPMMKFLRSFSLKDHRVNQLDIYWKGWIDFKLNIRAKNIEITKTIRPITVENVRSFVDPKSFPVENLSFIIHDPEDDIFDKDWSKITKFLRIELDFKQRIRLLRSQKLCDIRNNNVQVYSKNNYITTGTLAGLAKHWVETSKGTGTKFTFQFGLSSTDYAGYLQQLSTKIAELIEIQAINDDDQLWYSFEMGNEKELMIYRELGPHKKPTCNDKIIDWTLAMEIL